MKWTSSGPSADLEDRRGQRAMGGFGMRRAAPLGLGGLLLLFILSRVTGQDFFSMLEQTSNDPTVQPGPSLPVASSPEENKEVEFVSFVLDDVQDTFTKLLSGRYERAKLVLFREAVDSACGVADSATGPFYCPIDHKAYIDLSFYTELRQRFGAKGKFAEAYVLAHELGHHVQSLVGTDARVRELQQANPSAGNQLSVRLELQADCYAGVWAHAPARTELDPNDIEDGLNAAAAVGDDHIQRMTAGRVIPEKFTHGSSAQRMEWFRRGFDSGRMASCDTFGGGR